MGARTQQRPDLGKPLDRASAALPGQNRQRRARPQFGVHPAGQRMPLPLPAGVAPHAPAQAVSPQAIPTAGSSASLPRKTGYDRAPETLSPGGASEGHHAACPVPLLLRQRHERGLIPAHGRLLRTGSQGSTRETLLMRRQAAGLLIHQPPARCGYRGQQREPLAQTVMQLGRRHRRGRADAQGAQLVDTACAAAVYCPA